MERKETKSLLENVENSIIKMDRVFESMIKQFREGKKPGSKTFIRDIDNIQINGQNGSFKTKAYSLRRGEFNIWTGYNNEGKSQFLIFLSILQAIHEGKKTAFFSPENFPPDDFFDDIVHTITGKTTDRKSKDFCLTEDEYVHAIERVKDYFFFVYPMDGNKPDFRIDKIEQSLSYLAHEHDIFMAVIDPYIKIRHEILPGEPEHLYASRFMMDRINFTRSENISYHMVMHQTTPRREKKEQNYPKPNLYNIKGGGTFADSADNVLTVWRPYRGEDPLSTQVSFISEKIKKQKLVGIPYEVEMDFDRKTNRYKGLDGTDYFDGTVPPPKAMIPENNNVFKNVDNGFENEVAPF